jgi:hypothetical protein
MMDLVQNGLLKQATTNSPPTFIHISTVPLFLGLFTILLIPSTVYCSEDWSE